MSNFVGETYMQNEYFYIKDLNEKLQIKNIPDEMMTMIEEGKRPVSPLFL